MTTKHQLLDDGIVEFTLNHVSKLKTGDFIMSPKDVRIENLKFRIQAGRFQGEDEDHLSFFVKCVPVKDADFPDNWAAYADIEFRLLTREDSDISNWEFSYDTVFSPETPLSGWHDYKPWKVVLLKKSGYINRDSINLEVVVRDLIFFRFFTNLSDVPEEPLAPRRKMDTFIQPLFNQKKYSDITFIIGDRKSKIRAHKLVLSGKNKHFEKMIWTDHKGESEITLNAKDYPYDCVMSTFRFWYRQELVVSPDKAVRMHQFAKMIEETAILKAISLYINESNFLALLDYSVEGLPGQEKIPSRHRLVNGDGEGDDDDEEEKVLYDKDLNHHLWHEWMKKNAKSFLRSDGWLAATRHQLKRVLVSNNLAAGEYDIFYYTTQWAKERCKASGIKDKPENLRAKLEEAFYLIRFPIMKKQEFQWVLESQILKEEEIDAIESYRKTHKKSKDLKFSTERRTPELKAEEQLAERPKKKPRMDDDD